ncbi:efflux RND transporter periplasmic adaptor subunit [Methylophaga sp. SB9B]|nr:efflux RND transporter periplasmic adaptor subunit [Methylophaga sp. SB9B]
MVSESTETLTLSGSLTAERRALLSPRVDGLVKEVLVDAGYQVKQGDILLRQDAAIARQQLEQVKAATNEAQAAANEAERLVEEAKRLRGDNYISASELANRESNFMLSQAALAAAQAMQNTTAEQLRRHELPAPFSGVISAKMTEVGEWVNRGNQVLELVALEPVRLDVNVPQERFSEITTQTRVEILPDALPSRKLSGKITALVPVSNAQARSFLVRIVVDSEDVTLLPGTSASAVIYIGGDKAKGFLVPRDAVLRHPDGGRSVFVIDSNNRAQRRSVNVGSDSSEGIIITDGLTAEDLVVVRGNEVLRDNDEVEIVSDAR